jgi:outer membrane protein assembly factor BamB
MSTGDVATGGTGAKGPSRRRTIAALAGAALAGAAVAWPWGRMREHPPAVPAANGPLLWTANADLADEEFFGPVTADRLLLVEKRFAVRRRQPRWTVALSCLDAATGRRLWQAPLAPSSDDDGHEMQQLAVSGSVALVRTEARLQALDLHTGRPLWRRDRASGRGATAVPVGAGLMIDSGHDESAEQTERHSVEAYDADSGRLRWATEVQPELSTAGATIHAAGLLIGAGMSVSLASDAAVVYALDAATGRQRWWRPVEQDYGLTPEMALVHSGGVVFVSVDARLLVALDAATGAVRWRSRFRLRADGSDRAVGNGPSGADVPVVAGDTVYLCCADGVLRAFNVRNGRQRWAFAMDEEPSVMGLVPRRPRPVIGNDLVYVTSVDKAGDGKTMHVLGAADGRLRWRRSARSSTGGPVMAGGTLYLSDGEAVTAYNPVGTVRRRLDLTALGEDGITSLISDDARLYVLARTQVLALSLEG